MIIEEVKKYLELRFKCGQVDYKFCENFGFDCDKCPYHHDDTFKLKAHEITMWAIEKQIPKKTKETSFGTECSVCGSLVKIRGCARFAYCPYCGNKIDWTEESEEE